MWSFLDSPGRSAIPHRSASPIPIGDTDACLWDVEPRAVSKFRDSGGSAAGGFDYSVYEEAIYEAALKKNKSPLVNLLDQIELEKS